MTGTRSTQLHENIAKDLDELYDNVYDKSMQTKLVSDLIPPTAIAEMAVYRAGEPDCHVTG